MKRGLTGRHAISTAGGETVSAFIPNPLPPEPAIDFSGERRRRLEQATLALGRLDSVVILLPDPSLFLYSYIRREAILSSQIEGTQSSFSDLLLFELKQVPGVPANDTAEVSNYVAAMEYGIDRLRSGFPLCGRLLREVHGKLLATGRGSNRIPGEFRRSQNWIGGTRPGNAHFVPPPCEEIDSCMSALERFLHDEASLYPVLLKAALAHAQFETIHPFLDGNGRVGRLLITLMLHEAGVLSQPLLYVSLYFKQHRTTYYELLDAVRRDGDWEAWIDFFLDSVQYAANAAVQTTKRLAEMFNHDIERVTHGRSSVSALRVLAALRKRPALTISEAILQTQLSFPVVGKAMEALTKLGIVRELTGGKRNRVFVYAGYVSMLSDDMSPLSA